MGILNYLRYPHLYLAHPSTTQSSVGTQNYYSGWTDGQIGNSVVEDYIDNNGIISQPSLAVAWAGAELGYTPGVRQ